MNHPPLTLPLDNPFATRWVRPGAVPFLFAGSSRLDTHKLVERLSAGGWWGEIIGTHGSGKSTLLHTLLPSFVQAGRRPVLVALRDGQRRLPHGAIPTDAWHSATLVIVDGYEQLGWISRMRLKRRCRRVGCGLLVTAHRATGLPALVHVEPDVATVLRLVEHLTRGAPGCVDRDDVAQAFAAHGGNVRETLFALYDLYERRRPRQEPGAPSGLSHP